VTLGLRSGGLAEVTSGLGQGDTFVVTPATITPGARIRITAAPASAPQ
jgi:hypothetical protein